MRIIQFFFLLQIFVVFSLFSQSTCYARPYVFPWSMYLPAIINGGTVPPPVIIAERYLVLGQNGEIVKDIVTGLEWQRCSVGRTWNADTKSCDGTNTPYSWYDANALVFDDGWRVPNVTELRSLVYCSTRDPIYIGMDLYDTPCAGDYTRPTIIVEAFPNVPYEDNVISSHYWTSSTNDNDASNAWVVSFYKGGVGDDGPKWIPGLSIRLVRTAN